MNTLLAIVLTIGQAAGSTDVSSDNDAASPERSESATIQATPVEQPQSPPTGENQTQQTEQARVARMAEDIPDEQKLSRSSEYLTAMKEILDKVIRHLEEAREENDVIKLNCVNEKLTTIKGLLKISEQAEVALKEAVARKDHETAVHEFSKISIARQKCEQLLAESEACVGELAVYAGETEVEVEIIDEPNYSIDDMQEDLTTPPLWERPPAASPYQ